MKNISNREFVCALMCLIMSVFLTGWSAALSACSCLSPSCCRPLGVVLAPPAGSVLLVSPGLSAAPPVH